MVLPAVQLEADGSVLDTQLEVSLGRKDGTRLQIARSHESFDPLRDPTMRPTPFQAYLRIQIGCDKFCTYCIVPMTRGPEQGRPPGQIVEEVRHVGPDLVQACRTCQRAGQNNGIRLPGRPSW